MTTPRRALVVIDVQQDYFSGPLEIQHPAHTHLLPTITRTIDAATAADIPIAAFQHTEGEGSPVFDPGQPGFELHPDVASRRTSNWKSIVRRFGSVYADTDLAA